MALPNPVVVVPGITASDLSDTYAVTPEAVWTTLLHKNWERIVLHPDDLRYELQEPARVVPTAVFGTPYGAFIEELRHNLTEQHDKPVPVYPFPCDWRQPLDLVEQQLAVFVDEVIARTKLMRHYHGAGFDDSPRVNLVGHSMGGLIIAGYLQRRGAAAPVEKVATLGAPFRGSVVTDPGLPEDLYAVGTWQDGVVQTLSEFIRLHGLHGRWRRADAGCGAWLPGSKALGLPPAG